MGSVAPSQRTDIIATARKSAPASADSSPKSEAVALGLQHEHHADEADASAEPGRPRHALTSDDPRDQRHPQRCAVGQQGRVRQRYLGDREEQRVPARRARRRPQDVQTELAGPHRRPTAAQCHRDRRTTGRSGSGTAGAHRSRCTDPTPSPRCRPVRRRRRLRW